MPDKFNEPHNNKFKGDRLTSITLVKHFCGEITTISFSKSSISKIILNLKNQFNIELFVNNKLHL